MVGVDTVLKPALEAEACPVCGDRVSGYHYGLLTCESCKVSECVVLMVVCVSLARVASS